MHNWKTISSRTLCCASAVFAAVGLLLVDKQASAWPTTSPSARQAARLKYRPPANWIRHYLGDDRYKIAGGTWKVVSTQRDDRYHRADCPAMLRQSKDIVIGFPSAAHGREAGYAADPLCNPDNSSISPYGLSASAMAANTNGFNGQLVGKRITLSDGVSSIVLPKGWTHSKVQRFNFAGNTSSNESLVDPNGGAVSVSISRIASKYKMDMGRMLTPESYRASMNLVKQQIGKNAGSSSSNPFLSQLTQIMNSQQIDGYTLGGLRGVRITTPGTGGGVGGMQVLAAGKGTKAYQLQNSVTRSQLGDAVVKSFRPR